MVDVMGVEPTFAPWSETIKAHMVDLTRIELVISPTDTPSKK